MNPGASDADALPRCPDDRSPDSSPVRLRTFRRITSLAGLAALLISAWQLWERTRPVPLEIGPETTRIVEPLRNDGFVDYLEALNRKRQKGVTPENNAVVPLMRAVGPEEVSKPTRQEYFDRLGIADLPDEGDYFVNELKYADRLADRDGRPVQEVRESHNKESAEARSRPWKSAEFLDVHRRIEANTGPLERVIEASRCSEFFAPLTNANRPLTTGLAPPPIHSLRSLGRELQSRAMLHCGEGRIHAAQEDLLTIRRLAQRVRGDAIDLLVGLDLLRQSASGVGQLISTPEMTDDSLRQLLEAWHAIGDWHDPVDVIDRECRFESLDAVGDLVRQENVAPWQSKPGYDVNLILRDVNVYFDESVRTLRAGPPSKVYFDFLDQAPVRPRPPWLKTLLNKRTVRSQAIVSEFQQNEHTALEMIYRAVILGQVYDELVPLAVAVARHRAKTGHAPRQLAELVPDFLDQVSIDPWSGEPYLYRVQEDRVTVYSVGPDGEDDGGERPYNDGDILLDIPLRAAASQ